MIDFERGKYKFTLQIKNNGLVLKYYIKNSNYKWIDVTTYYTGINQIIIINPNTRFNIYLANTKFNPYGTKLIN